MPEIRFSANDRTIQTIGSFIDDTRGTRVAQAALRFTEWAIKEINEGREIQAVDKEGNVHTPIFFFPEQGAEE